MAPGVLLLTYDRLEAIGGTSLNRTRSIADRGDLCRPGMVGAYHSVCWFTESEDGRCRTAIHADCKVVRGLSDSGEYVWTLPSSKQITPGSPAMHGRSAGHWNPVMINQRIECNNTMCQRSIHI